MNNSKGGVPGGMAARRAAAFGRSLWLRQGFDCPVGDDEKGCLKKEAAL